MSFGKQKVRRVDRYSKPVRRVAFYKKPWVPRDVPAGETDRRVKEVLTGNAECGSGAPVRSAEQPKTQEGAQ